MIEFKVKKGVPSEDRVNAKYPFGKMDVGTFFEVPAGHPAAKINKTTRACPVQHAAHSYARLKGLKFRTERQEDGSVRVYRVA